MAPQRILFTDSTQGGVLGGSLTGILELLPHLDRARFEPVLALYERKPIIEELEAGGSRSTCCRSRPRRSVWTPHPAARCPGVEPVAHHRLSRPRAGADPAPGAAGDRLLLERRRPGLPVVTAAAWCGIPVICHFKGFRRIVPAARFMSRWIDTSSA